VLHDTDINNVDKNYNGFMVVLISFGSFEKLRQSKSDSKEKASLENRHVKWE
jgi:hypothetical protein